jgi:hypothetical protein
MNERIIETSLIAKIKALGGEVRKVSWVGHRGAPDRLVLLPDQHFFVELKAPGKTPQHHQSREIKRLEIAGFRVCVIDSLEQVEAIRA